MAEPVTRAGKTRAGRDKRLPTIGWREWAGLPELGIAAIKAKVDTGARSSALHAFAPEFFHRQGKPMVRFEVHPLQRDRRQVVVAEVQVVEERGVRDSGGRREMRPVIVTEVELAGQRWPIEVTLTDRDSMGFRMLLGRQAVRRRFLVDAGRSFVAGRLSDGMQ